MYAAKLETILLSLVLFSSSGLIGEETAVLRDPKVFQLTKKDAEFWAFQPVIRPAMPPGDATHPIDRFIDHRLKQKGLRVTPRASRVTLIKRLYFDLVGLPPSYNDVERFARDESPEAYEQVADDLLASPRYGERWGRHWLDVVRFAQTNGYERDDEKPYAWRFRDYVIRAFNQDKPYDRFLQEQIAGDELPDGDHDSLIATGFYRLGVWDDEPDDKRQAEMDELDDMVRVTSETFMGLTMGCARCHHHMFDPVSQEDYYSMVAFFRNAHPYAPPSYGPDSATYTPLVESEALHRWREKWRAKQKVRDESSGKERERLERELKAMKERAPFDGSVALTLRELGAEPPPTKVMIRGDAGSPGKEVFPAIPAVFKQDLIPITVPESKRSTGRRTALARWMTSPSHPLTARVMVNRIWKHHFGQGFVATANDFGKSGVPPTHRDLLDWLAEDFVRNGWSVKRLHRLILTSEAYQRSSETIAESQSSDPGNQWVWRQNMRRLEAEAVRDRLLMASGRVNFEMEGRGFFPTFAGEVLAGGSRPGRGWGTSADDQESRRSVYAFVKRTMMVPFLEAFDYSNTEGSVGVRATTTVPTQALTLLNSAFVSDQAQALTQRVLRLTSGDESETIRKVFREGLSRDPIPAEFQMGATFLQEQRAAQIPLARQLRFTPEVPQSLEKAFCDLLPAERFLLGPRPSWQYDKGVWGSGYEGIVVVERLNGPFALLNHEASAVSGRLSLGANIETAGLLWGKHELVIDRQSDSLLVRDIQGAVIHKIAWSQNAAWHAFEIKNKGIRFDGIEFPIPLEFAQLGVRAWGDVVLIDDLRLTDADGKTHWVDADGVHSREPSPESLADRRALQEFCAMLFNLNEFVHVD
ncbi:MAG: hypothetical protein ACI8T1_000272 [Verrucomicrobiales bacterium]